MHRANHKQRRNRLRRRRTKEEITRKTSKKSTKVLARMKLCRINKERTNTTKQGSQTLDQSGR
eukprot:1745545-Heterocapsa_arctica.AAC.1